MAIERLYLHGPGPNDLVAGSNDIWSDGRAAVRAFRSVLLDPPGGVFYVGQTARLARRMYSHGRKVIDPRTIDADVPTVHVSGGVYQEMHVIFRTDRDDSLRQVESQLEAWSRAHFGSQEQWELATGNRAGGGAGRRTSGPYYIYVLRGLRPGGAEYQGRGYRRPGS